MYINIHTFTDYFWKETFFLKVNVYPDVSRQIAIEYWGEFKFFYVKNGKTRLI